MLWMILVAVLVLWWLGLLGSVGGGFIHALLIIPAGILLFQAFGRRPRRRRRRMA